MKKQLYLLFINQKRENVMLTETVINAIRADIDSLSTRYEEVFKDIKSEFDVIITNEDNVPIHILAAELNTTLEKVALLKAAIKD